MYVRCFVQNDPKLKTTCTRGVLSTISWCNASHYTLYGIPSHDPWPIGVTKNVILIFDWSKAASTTCAERIPTLMSTALSLLRAWVHRPTQLHCSTTTLVGGIQHLRARWKELHERQKKIMVGNHDVAADAEREDIRGPALTTTTTTTTTTMAQCLSFEAWFQLWKDSLDHPSLLRRVWHDMEIHFPEKISMVGMIAASIDV
jgi:hypothetical protein